MRPEEVVRLLAGAEVGSRWRMTVDFGAAYDALTGRKRRKGIWTAPVHRELLVTVRSVTVHGLDYPGAGGGRFAVEVAWERFKVPSEIRTAWQLDARWRAPQLRVGADDDRGGMCDGSWILGQHGPIVRMVAA